MLFRSDITGFVDLGIAGGNWDGTQANSLGNALLANDAYLYVQNGTGSAGGNLVLGASSSGKKVKILAGGVGSSSIVATFGSTGSQFVGTVTAGSFVGDGSGLTGIVSGVSTATVNSLIANSLTNYATQSYVLSRGYTTTATVN